MKKKKVKYVVTISGSIDGARFMKKAKEFANVYARIGDGKLHMPCNLDDIAGALQGWKYIVTFNYWRGDKRTIWIQDIKADPNFTGWAADLEKPIYVEKKKK